MISGRLCTPISKSQETVRSCVAAVQKSDESGLARKESWNLALKELVCAWLQTLTHEGDRKALLEGFEAARALTVQAKLGPLDELGEVEDRLALWLTHEQRIQVEIEILCV